MLGFILTAAPLSSGFCCHVYAINGKNDIPYYMRCYDKVSDTTDQELLNLRVCIFIFIIKCVRQTFSIAWYYVTIIIIYKEMFLGCDWLIRVQLIPNITQNSAKICNTVQKSVTTVQKSVTTVQKSVISSLSDGIYSQKTKNMAAEFSRLLEDFVEISTQFGILL